MDKKPLPALLLGLLLTCGALPAAPATVPDIPVEAMPADEEMEKAGARIGRIDVDIGDVFETNREHGSALAELVDRLHYRTRDSTVRAQLLFASGEPYSARLLAESERVLRQTAYLSEVSVFPIAYHDGVVDVRVRTRDVWTLNVGASFGRHGGQNTSGFELEDMNLLGSGSRLGLSFKSNVDRSATSLRFRDSRLIGNWWNLDAQIATASDGYLRAASVERPFYSLDTRWAAGASLLQNERIDSRYSLGHIVGQFGETVSNAEAYFGRSQGLHDGWAARLKFGVTLDEHRFDPVADFATVVPQDRKLLYPWVGYELVQDVYATARNQDQIGRTEDRHPGWQAAARVGWASDSLGSSLDAAVFEMKVSRGVELSSRQRLEFEGAGAGRFEGSNFRDAVASAAARYYFRSTDRTLTFASASFQVGHALDADHQILLGGDSGLRGYPLRYGAGSGRWLITAEQRWYTDWYPFELMHVGAATFADVGQSFGKGPGATPEGQRLLSDVGVGLRLSNSRSARGSVLHIDLAFPLQRSPSISGLQFLIQTRRSF